MNLYGFQDAVPSRDLLMNMEDRKRLKVPPLMAVNNPSLEQIEEEEPVGF